MKGIRAAAVVAVAIEIAAVHIRTAVAERRGMAEVNRLLTPDLYIPPGENDTGALKVHQGAYHVWSDNKRYFGCIPPKVACTSWLTYIRTLELPDEEAKLATARENKYRPISFPESGLHFRHWKESEGQLRDAASLVRVLNSGEYFKWAMVRHPWQRLVSGYRSKYEGHCNYSTACMEKLFRVPARNRTSYSFHEFVQTLSETPTKFIDPHFRPLYLLCDLNHIRYDFIGDLGIAEDADYIADRMGYGVAFTNYSGISKGYSRGPNSTYYGKGRTHDVQPCRARTVFMAEQLFAGDAVFLGYSFHDALKSCRLYQQTSPPIDAASMTKADRKVLREKNGGGGLGQEAT